MKNKEELARDYALSKNKPTENITPLQLEDARYFAFMAGYEVIEQMLLTSFDCLDVKVEPIKGANIGFTFMEAIKMRKLIKNDLTFKFNDNEYCVRENTTLDDINKIFMTYQKNDK